MLALPELQIQAALKRGFAAVGANVALLDDIFAHYPAGMLADVKQYLTDHQVDVVLNWPAEDVTLPVIAVVNAGDTEAADRDALGDFFEELEVAHTDSNVIEYRGIAKNGSYKVLVLTRDAQPSIYLSYLVTTMLVLNAPAFQEAGMHNILIGEADLRFEQPLAAAWINSRMVTVTCLHYHAVPVTDRILTAFQVFVTVED